LSSIFPSSWRSLRFENVGRMNLHCSSSNQGG
jgi:hypothetical protein